MNAFSARLCIDAEALGRNYDLLGRISGKSCETAPSVKADAYGLGVEQVLPVLYARGARSFFVATPQEAVEIRTLFPDFSGVTLYVLNGFFDDLYGVYQEYSLIPVLNSLCDIASYRARVEGSELPAVLHFDTGMNRLGIPWEEAAQIYGDPALLGGIDLRLVMSHFSASEETQSPSNRVQFDRFCKIMAHFPGKRFSMCNSGGVFLPFDSHLDVIRPGIALYGGKSTDGQADNPMEAVVSLDAPVLQVHAVKKGKTAGYNGTYRFKEDSHVVVIGMGYADGLFRTLSNRGMLFWKGYPLPICGRVSMDLVTCSLRDVPENAYPMPGDMVEVIGPNQSLDDVAHAAGTISYDILTALGPRVFRCVA